MVHRSEPCVCWNRGTDLTVYGRVACGAMREPTSERNGNCLM